MPHRPSRTDDRYYRFDLAISITRNNRRRTFIIKELVLFSNVRPQVWLEDYIKTNNLEEGLHFYIVNSFCWESIKPIGTEANLKNIISEHVTNSQEFAHIFDLSK